MLGIGGHAACGLVGLSADLRAFCALNVRPMSVLSCMTVKSVAVREVFPIAREVFRAQLARCAKLPIRALKIGALVNMQQVQDVIEFSACHSEIPIVWDPVFASSDQLRLSADDPQDIIRALAPICTLVTPNLLEAAELLQKSLTSDESIVASARAWVDLGAKAVLVKGGHRVRGQGKYCSDLFYAGDGSSHWLSLPWLAHGDTHVRGTGCTLAASVAGALAYGYELIDAVVLARMLLNQAIRERRTLLAKAPEPSAGSLCQPSVFANPIDFPKQAGDLPLLTTLPPKSMPPPFADCGEQKLGLYPVVDSAEWVARLLPLGITTIQLRVKHLSGSALREQLQASIAIARKYRARLFINDHWQLACELGAYGVHLGQEDLCNADLGAIRRAGLRLGLSTHCYYEVARACAIRPSYIACGPVFHTDSKVMPWVPQSLEGLSYWRQLITQPLVAIGGIDVNNVAAVARTGVDGIAMISAITKADNPEKMVYLLQQKMAVK